MVILLVRSAPISAAEVSCQQAIACAWRWMLSVGSRNFIDMGWFIVMLNRGTLSTSAVARSLLILDSFLAVVKAGLLSARKATFRPKARGLRPLTFTPSG